MRPWAQQPAQKGVRMARQEEEKNDIFVIPENVVKKGRILGFRRRSWVEAAVAAVIMGLLIGLIPFVIKVRIIVTAVVAGAVFVFFLVGIRRRTISEWFLAWLKYKTSPGHMSLCDPRHKKAKAVEAYSDSGEHLSMLEQTIALIKKLIHQKLTEGNGTDANTLQKAVSTIKGFKR